MDSRLTRYYQILSSLQKHLKTYAEKKWSCHLTTWINELPKLSDMEVNSHLQRTRKALGGMGSIGDIVICPENGHIISANENEITKANDQLRKLVNELASEINDILHH